MSARLRAFAACLALLGGCLSHVERGGEETVEEPGVCDAFVGQSCRSSDAPGALLHWRRTGCMPVELTLAGAGGVGAAQFEKAVLDAVDAWNAVGCGCFEIVARHEGPAKPRETAIPVGIFVAMAEDGADFGIDDRAKIQSSLVYRRDCAEVTNVDLILNGKRAWTVNDVRRVVLHGLGWAGGGWAAGSDPLSETPLDHADRPASITPAERQMFCQGTCP